MVHIGNDWDELLAEEFRKDYYLQLREFLKREYFSRTIFPDMYDIFNALKFTPYHKVKAVILGQDPYHEKGQAHGLSFSVRRGVPQPPSLQNIFRELQDDLGCPPPPHGCLESWAREGVLLLNTVLTVREHQANSHAGKGWEILTDQIIRLLNQRREPMVFLLWGRPARNKKKLITNPAHLIIEAPHPSPLSASRGFFGGRFFSRTNEFLQEPIHWEIGD
ncbi:MAG: uracil-DNA glycosylase [Anaerovoracaceae bacterium]|jgi:uracil-DNA glycosylase